MAMNIEPVCFPNDFQRIVYNMANELVEIRIMEACVYVSVILHKACSILVLSPKNRRRL